MGPCSQQAYDQAIAQVRRAIEDVTDLQLDALRSRRADFAQLVAEQRERKRAGAEYQARVAEAERDKAYERDVNRRRLADTLNQREACFLGMGEPPRPGPTRRASVARLTPRFQR